MERLKQSHDVDIKWRSYELRPAGTVITDAYRDKILSYRPAFQQRALEQYGITINFGPFGIDSRPALVGAKYADAQGVGEAYHDGVMHAYWQEARDISDIEVLSAIAVEAGMERAAFQTALDDPQWDALVSADVEQAMRYGISGVPAQVLANKYLVSGAQPYETFVSVVEQIEAEA